MIIPVLQTHQASPGVVHEEHPAFKVRHGDEVGAVLDQADEAVALLFAPAQVGDVARHGQDPIRATVRP